MKLLKKIKNLLNINSQNNHILKELENIKLQNGEILNRLNKNNKSTIILDNEFKVYSQWGEDGIISYLIDNIKIKNNFFVEFGVENYTESNTRFLCRRLNWSGLVIDSSKKNIDYIKKDRIYWHHDLTAINEFVTKDNINKIFQENIPFKEIGLLSIDIDGNDYWIWKAIESIQPSIVIVEYNSIFGSEKNYVVPYEENFNRNKAHYSNLYYGASLPALVKLGNAKDYALVTCNRAGNNAFFVKKDLLNDNIKEISVSEGFQKRKFRESRDKNNNLSFLNSEEEKKLVLKLPLEEV